MAYLNAITKTIKQIQDSDEDTRDRYNYHRGLSLHMIKKLMGADHSQWGYINNALKSGIVEAAGRAMLSHAPEQSAITSMYLLLYYRLNSTQRLYTASPQYDCLRVAWLLSCVVFCVPCRSPGKGA